MYRGNVPGQFNGNQIQSSGQEYPNPGHNYGVRLPQPNQMSVQQQNQAPTMHGRVIPGQQGGHAMSDMQQHFPDSSFGHSTPASHSQMQFGATQQYSADRYAAYNQGKMVRSGLAPHSQSYSGMSTSNMPPNHMYSMQQNHGRSVAYGGGGAGSNVPDLPVVSETSLSMQQQYRNSKTMSTMWTGSKPSDAATHHPQYGQSNDTSGIICSKCISIL